MPSNGNLRAAVSLTDSAGDPSIGAGKGESPAKHRNKAQDSILIGLTEACEFWHDANRTAFVTFRVADHREHWAVRSREFKMWLSGQFYVKTAGTIRSQALEDGIQIPCLSNFFCDGTGESRCRGAARDALHQQSASSRPCTAPPFDTPPYLLLRSA